MSSTARSSGAERSVWRAATPRRWAGPLAAATAFVLVVGFPLLELTSAGLAFGWAGVTDAFGRTGAARATFNTLWTAVVVTPVAVVAGTTAAMFTERSAVPGRRALRLVVLLSLFIPPFVAAQSWASAYGPGGLTDDLLGFAIPGMYGPVGVVAVLIVDAAPLAYIVVVGGLASRAEPDLARAARASGATAWRAFQTVTLPLLKPALIAAGALVFITTINAFGVPAILGLPGGFVTVTTRIYRDLAFSADPASFTRVVVLAVSLVVITLVTVGLADALGALRGPATRTGAPPGGEAPPGRRSWAAAAALWGYAVISGAVPLVALTLTALNRAVGLAPVPANWTLGNFAEAVSEQSLDALANSLLLAIAAATGVVLLGGLLTSLPTRRLGRVLGTGAALTFAVPGSALAVAVLLAYGQWLRDTLLLILIAYVAKFWAFGHRAIAGAVDGLPPDLPRAARASGAGAGVALRTVVLPLLRPALVGAWLLVFVIAVHELTMSALLYGPGSRTLAVTILNAQQLGNVTVTSALAVLLMLLVLAAAVPLLLVGWRRSR